MPHRERRQRKGLARVEKMTTKTMLEDKYLCKGG